MLNIRQLLSLNTLAGEIRIFFWQCNSLIRHSFVVLTLFCRLDSTLIFVCLFCTSCRASHVTYTHMPSEHTHTHTHTHTPTTHYTQTHKHSRACTHALVSLLLVLLVSIGTLFVLSTLPFELCNCLLRVYLARHSYPFTQSFWFIPRAPRGSSDS